MPTVCDKQMNSALNGREKKMMNNNFAKTISRLFFATRFIWVVKKATVLLAGLSLAFKNA
jgi:hypothetical protein